MSGPSAGGDQLLTPSEVAALFRVDPKTVTRWSRAGKLSCVRTLGGHRRYPASEVYALLDQTQPIPSVAPTKPVPQPMRTSAGQPHPFVIAETAAPLPLGEQRTPRTLNLSKRNVRSYP